MVDIPILSYTRFFVKQQTSGLGAHMEKVSQRFLSNPKIYLKQIQS